MPDHDESAERTKKSSNSAKTKDLSHVPCKFFKVGGCTAGASCPFSHSSAEPGQPKESCTWFVKGNCKFGHKCALAHILPGQPMSMDRKNKKAAQQANQQSQPQKRPQKRDPTSASAQQSNRLPLLAGGSTAPTRILNATAPKDRLKATISPSAPAPPLKDADFDPIGHMEGVEPDQEEEKDHDSDKQDPEIDTKPPTPAHLPLSAPRPSAAPPTAEFGPVGSPRNGIAFSPGTSPRNPPPPSSPPHSSSYTASGIAASLGSSLAIMNARKESQQQQLPPQTSLLTARMAESAVEDDDLDVIPGSLTDLLTPEERRRRFSRSAATQPLSESLNAGHRYSRSVPAASLLGDLKSIWADPSPQQQQTPPQRTAPTYSTGFEPDGGLSMSVGNGGTPSSVGVISPSNASAAFLGLHSHYLSAKAKQAQQAQLGQGQGGLSRVLRGASNPSAANNLANNYLQPLGGLGLPSSVSSSTLHTHIHAGTATTYRTTPSPFDLTHHPVPPLTTKPDDHHLVSPSTRALQSHAPGTSLPQGLAAGYSRIHALPPLPNIVSPPVSSSPGNYGHHTTSLNPMADADWSDTGFSRIPYSAVRPPGAPPGLTRNPSGTPGRGHLSPLGVGVVTGDDDLFTLDQ